MSVAVEVHSAIPVRRGAEHGADRGGDFLNDLGIAKGIKLPHVVAIQ